MSQSYPHIVSRVNGMKIPLLPGQAGIMHRFDHPENRLVVASTTHNPITDARDDAAALIIPSNSAPEGAGSAPAAAAPTQAGSAQVSDELAAMRAQMAEQAAQLAAATEALAAATAKPVKAKPAKAKAEPAPVEGGVL